MSEFFYQIAISFINAVIPVAALFNKKIRLGAEGRRGLFDRLERVLDDSPAGQPVAWFHAASLGEFEQGRPVIEAFRTSYPDHFILLTFFSPSGYEVRKNYAGADFVCYLPFDTRRNARRFVGLVRPDVAFFIKYEFWFNYLTELRKTGVRIISFSAKFRSGQVFFKGYGGFFRRMLDCFDMIFVQNQQSVDLLREAGIMQCRIAGDTRFDRVLSIARGARDLPEMGLLRFSEPWIVAGSVWEADMEVLIPVLNHFRGTLRAIIAPHEIDPSQISSWQKRLHGKSILYSDLLASESIVADDYLFVNNIGMLSALYRYGNMAYIGGSFGAGLHNILEAATFGLPIAFGNKKYSKFQEAVDLVNGKGAVAVSGVEELKSVLSQWIGDPGLASETGQINAAYVATGAGSTELIMQYVRQIV